MYSHRAGASQLAGAAAWAAAMLFAAQAAAMTPADIDAYFEARWRAKTLAPSAVTEDGLFARRVWLDLAGLVPKPDAVIGFEADASPTKRAALVERLLGSSFFADAWAERLRNLLLAEPDAAKNRQLARGFERWLAKMLATGATFDRITTALVAARGTPRENPEVAFVAQFKESPEALVGRYGKIFLGIQIQCAQCHDHPFEKWSRRDFYGLQAFFARAAGVPIPSDALTLLRQGRVDEIRQRAEQQAKNPGELAQMRRRIGWLLAEMPVPSMLAEDLADPMSPGQPKMEEKIQILVDKPDGEAIMPSERAAASGMSGGQGETIIPKFPDGGSPEWPDPGSNRRAVLAAWTTSASNPYFGRAIVNRVWSVLMGRGLVTPVDNIAKPDDATHGPLLDRLAAHFAASGYDLRGLLRLLVSTAVYQRSFSPSANNADDRQEFSRAARRPLDPAQMYRSLFQATGFANEKRLTKPEEFQRIREQGMVRFSRVFENDSGEEDDTFQGTLTQALFLLNSPELNRAMNPQPWSTLRSVLETAGDDSARIRTLYLAAYARRPSADEAALAGTFIRQRRGQPGGWWRPRVPAPEVPAWSDLFWSLLTSAEFLVNH